MRQIKIISDPYEKYTKFQLKTNTKDGEIWVDVDNSLNRNSKLLAKEFTTKFFPFKIGEIIETIVDEYGIGEPKIEIVFKGTLDHFNDLKDVIEMNKYKVDIQLSQDDDYLLNAEDVLPKIIKIFRKLMPIIDLCDKNKENIKLYLKKFSESSADVIPLCVIGNVSAGKSTFINSLIGQEILPSADESTTGKIFKILQLNDGQNMYTKFKYSDKEVTMLFGDEVIISDNCPAEIKSVLDQIIEEHVDSTSARIMKECFSFFNSIKDKKMNPLIEIGTPFIKGIWSECNNKFIIIDTPGSNSASKEEHALILDEALKDLTNGLPLYVSKTTDLDTIDSLNLFQKIKKMPEIDSRFTMIIANQADNSNLPDEGYFSKRKEKQILGQPIPENMYSIGIYYVSSIMGLGSKTNEQFSSLSYKRTFIKNKEFFEKDSDYALKLYNYNIMPDQIKKQNTEKCISKTDDPIYVNSGLYSVESGIQNYANKYSAYNKCQQSVLYLTKITKLVDEELDELKKNSQKHKKELSEQLEIEKKELIETIEEAAQSKKAKFVSAGKDSLYAYTTTHAPNITLDVLFNYEKSFTEQQRQSIEYDKYTKIHEESKQDVINDFNDIIQNFKTTSFKQKRDAAIQAGEDAWKIATTWNDQRKKRIEANENASNDIFNQTSEDYKLLTENFFSDLNLESQHTWDEKSEAIKHILTKIVYESEILDEDKKNELAEIIINYENIKYEVPEKPQFELKEYKRFFSEGKLNLPKLEKKINNECTKYAKSALENILMNHIRCLNTWLIELLQKIITNIVSYNPSLSKLQAEINIEEANINELQYKQETIEKYINHIKALMNWQIA